MSFTGWTWDYIEFEMDFVRIKALNKFWSDHPPIQIMIEGYLGIGSNKNKKNKNIDIGALKDAIKKDGSNKLKIRQFGEQ